jgi:hypothetical protein
VEEDLVTPWLLPLLAYAAMVVQDVLGSVMVMAEAGRRPHTAALCDMAQDAAVMASLGSFTGALLTRDVPLTAAVVAARLAADYSGTYAGVRLGARLIKPLKAGGES